MWYYKRTRWIFRYAFWSEKLKKVVTCYWGSEFQLQDIGCCGLHVVSGTLHTEVVANFWPIEKVLRSKYYVQKYYLQKYYVQVSA